MGLRKYTIVAKIIPFLRWEGQVPKALSNPIPNKEFLNVFYIFWKNKVSFRQLGNAKNNIFLWSQYTISKEEGSHIFDLHKVCSARFYLPGDGLMRLLVFLNPMYESNETTQNFRFRLSDDPKKSECGNLQTKMCIQCMHWVHNF